MGAIEYSVINSLSAYPRAFQVGKRFPKHQKPFLVMFFITLSILAFFFYHNWVNALFIFARPMVIPERGW